MYSAGFRPLFVVIPSRLHERRKWEHRKIMIIWKSWNIFTALCRILYLLRWLSTVLKRVWKRSSLFPFPTIAKIGAKGTLVVKILQKNLWIRVCHALFQTSTKAYSTGQYRFFHRGPRPYHHLPQNTEAVGLRCMVWEVETNRCSYAYRLPKYMVDRYFKFSECMELIW